MIFEFRTIAMCDHCGNWWGSREARDRFEALLVGKGWHVVDVVLCPECAQNIDDEGSGQWPPKRNAP